MYGVSCLAMLANFLSGLELPAREVAELGAAETNEMSAPGHSFFPGHPIVAGPVFGAQALANYNRLGSGALLYIPANISISLAARRGSSANQSGRGY